MKTRVGLSVVLIGSILLQCQASAQDANPNADLDRQAKMIANEQAEVALAKSKLDYETSKSTIPSSGFSGAVTANQISATAETNVLYSRLLPALATEIAGFVATACAQSTSVVLYSATDKRTFSDLRAFELANTRLTQELDGANADFEKLTAPPAASTTNVFPIVVAAGMAALSMLKSDYTLGGASLTTTDTQLNNLIAGTLKANRLAYLAAELTPASNATFLTADIKILDDKASKVASDLALATRWVASLTKKQASEDTIAPFQGALAKLQTAMTDYQAWAKGLTTADAAGDIPLTRINVQKMIADPKACSALVHVDSAAGSNYSKKNIVTGIGIGMPFFASAEATASYRVWGPNGSIAVSGMITKDSGFTRLDRIHH